MTATARELPTGTVTFFFSDIQGSTGLLQRLGPGYRDVLERHARIIRRILREHGGIEVSTEGDSFFAVFASADGAVGAAAQIQQALAVEAWPEGGTVAVRIGLHAGIGELGHDNYIGIDVNRAARISAAGHGGQVVLSEAVRTLVSGAIFSDLGEHGLKGLEGRTHLYQLDVPGLPQTFPPLRTERARPHNLPALASRIVGRDSELATLKELFAEHRLITLTGPGGIGKTRLALEVANDAVDRFEKGAYFVDLAAVDDPEFVIPEIATTVGVDPSANGGLAGALSDGSRLLVLDNLEQVIEAAPALSSLLSGAAQLTLLATSQVPLRIAGETVIRLAPLDRTDSTSPAVQLFAARATQADSSFDLESNTEDVVRLVEVLDGVPLAIELAAARVNVLTPAQILERLGSGVLKTSRSDAPDRHRSLSAAVEWSYGLLEAPQQDLLQVLSAFNGGTTLAALEAVAGRDPLDDLGELIDRSLVTPESGESGKRFDLLAPVRRFVRGRLDDPGALATRHAAYFMDLASEAHQPLEGDARARWLAVLSDDHDNLRATLDHQLEAGDLEGGFDMLGNIWRFFHSTGQFDELNLWLGRFFDADSAADATLPRARALVARAALHYWRGEWRETVADYEAALAIAEELDARPLAAEVLAGLAGAQGLALSNGEMLGNPIETGERAHAVFEELGDTVGMATIEFGKVMMEAFLAPEPVPPEPAVIERIIDLGKQSGRLMNVAHTQGVLGEIHLINGDYRRGRQALLEAMDTAEAAGDTFTMIAMLRWLAVTTVEAGDPELGARLAGAAASARERAGGAFPPPFAPIDSAEDRARAVIGAQADAAFAEGREVGLFEAVRLAREATTAG